MPGFVSEKKRVKEPIMSLSDSVKKDTSICTTQLVEDVETPILPGLPDDVAKHCLALVPRTNFPAMASVCKKWRCFIQTKEFLTVRKLAGVLEEWLYILTANAEGKESHWEVLDHTGQVNRLLPLMPGALKVGFGVAVLNGKLLVLAGYSLINGAAVASPDVYQYDSCLNRFVSIITQLYCI